MKKFARILPACLLLPALFSGSVQAQVQQGTRIISGAGLVQFNHAANLKPGLWATYVIRTDAGGDRTEAYEKVTLTGFEVLEHERCAWIETEYAVKGTAPQYCRTLVSLKISRDPRGTETTRLPYYVRKIQTMDMLGGQVKESPFPKVQDLNATNSTPIGNSATAVKESRDTLPATDVVTDVGRYHVIPSRWTRNSDFRIPINGGATRMRIQREQQVSYRTLAVPLTNLAKQTTVMSLQQAVIPFGADKNYQPQTPPFVSRKEVVLAEFGANGKSVFPKNAKTVPMIQLPQQGESGSAP